jgi:hypothetical protein
VAHAGKRRRAVKEKTEQEEIMNQARREPSFGLVLSGLESPNLLTPTFWALFQQVTTRGGGTKAGLVLVVKFLEA